MIPMSSATFSHLIYFEFLLHALNIHILLVVLRYFSRKLCFDSVYILQLYGPNTIGNFWLTLYFMTLTLLIVWLNIYFFNLGFLWLVKYILHANIFCRLFKQTIGRKKCKNKSKMLVSFLHSGFFTAPEAFVVQLIKSHLP